MAVPLDPACFRIEDPSLNWLASESGSQNSLQCFACIGHQDKKNSKVVIFTWKIRNVLNRKKNHISDFSDFYFLSYGQFCTENCQFSMHFHDSSKIKIRKIRKLIFHSIQHLAHLSWEWEKNWEDGGSAYPYFGQDPKFLIPIWFKGFHN